MGNGTSKLRHKDIQSLVFVQWNSRLAAFDRRSSVATIIKKASAHFKLGTIQEELVLQIEIQGKKIEVTDDVFKHFPDRGTISLVRIPRNDSDREHNTDLSLKGGEGYYGVDMSCPPPSHSHDGHSHKSSGAQNMSSSCSSEEWVYRKPVIYLFPAQYLPHATVSVSLVPQLSFTSTYPSSETKILEDGRQMIVWSVSADSDGTLVERASGFELSYLFWEASSGSGAPPSPQLAPVGQDVYVEQFDPANPSLEPDHPTAVLLPHAQLLPYLDTVLRSLTLHTAARNDFITYWLPALSRYPYTALRFLPQAVYERVANLKVVPTPDVITRIFMLFRGVDEADVDVWAAARDRVAHVDWETVIGVKKDRAADKNMFRVLEWGGYEVS